MYLFHSTVNVKPEHRESFEQSHEETSPKVRNAPGFIKRILLKDRENPGRYYFMAFWETFEQLQAYRNREETKAYVKEITAADIMSEPVYRVECELIHSLGRLPEK